MKKMISISTAVALFIFIAFIITMIVAGILSPKLRDYERMKERQAERNQIELSEQGGTRLYTPPNWEKDKPFNYHIRSWDAGKNWYAVEYDDDWGLKILGDAKEMYPGLLEHIKGIEQLTKYVEDNGSIDGDDQLGIDALENAGFTVKRDTTE